MLERGTQTLRFLIRGVFLNPPLFDKCLSMKNIGHHMRHASVTLPIINDLLVSIQGYVTNVL